MRREARQRVLSMPLVLQTGWIGGEEPKHHIVALPGNAISKHSQD
jgi:hypothetical protein